MTIYLLGDKMKATNKTTESPLRLPTTRFQSSFEGKPTQVRQQPFRESQKDKILHWKSQSQNYPDCLLTPSLKVSWPFASLSVHFSSHPSFSINTDSPLLITPLIRSTLSPPP